MMPDMSTTRSRIGPNQDTVPRHNLAYWLNNPYLGVGPGAHSSIEGRRFANAKSPRGYIKAINEGESPNRLLGNHVSLNGNVGNHDARNEIG